MSTGGSPFQPFSFDCIFQEHQWLIVFTTALGGAIAFMGKRFPEHILLGIAIAVTFFIVIQFMAQYSTAVGIGHYLIAVYCAATLGKFMWEYDKMGRHNTVTKFNGGCLGAISAQFIIGFLFPTADLLYVWAFALFGIVMGVLWIYRLEIFLKTVVSSYVGAYILVQPFLSLLAMYQQTCIRADRVGIVLIIITGSVALFTQVKLWHNIYTKDEEIRAPLHEERDEQI